MAVAFNLESERLAARVTNVVPQELEHISSGKLSENQSPQSKELG
jgi:hypothetical protein